jgi:hypothetical protein
MSIRRAVKQNKQSGYAQDRQQRVDRFVQWRRVRVCFGRHGGKTEWSARMRPFVDQTVNTISVNFQKKLFTRKKENPARQGFLSLQFQVTRCSGTQSGDRAVPPIVRTNQKGYEMTKEVGPEIDCEYADHND